MRFFAAIPSILKNKYLLTGVAFIVWMLFFDSDDYFVQSQRRSELNNLQESKSYYTSEIEKERHFSEELKSNPAAIEKLAREKYFMKKDNEELFLVREPEK